MPINQDVLNSLICGVREGRLESARELINSFGLSFSQAWSEGYVLLCDALKNKRVEVAKLLLTSNSNVNGESQKPCDTALHLAVINGDIEIVEMILDKGANINAKNQYGETPLHIAIDNEKMEVAELLLKYGADANTKDNDGTSLLHVAVNNKIGCFQIVEHLLKNGAKVDDQDANGKTTLYLAVEKGSLEIVKDLLKYCPDITNQTNRSSVKIAVLGDGEEYKKIVEAILEYGFIVNSADANNPKLLRAAVEKGYLKIVEDLLKYGANVNTLYDPEFRRLTPLHYAAKNKQEEVARLLISYEADIDAQDKTGKTPIFYAIENTNLKITELLLAKGANVNANQYCGITALHTAIERGRKEIVNVSPVYGVGVVIKFKSDITPLHSDAENGNQEIVETILKFGADINCRDEDGNTPLHLASFRGHIDVVKTLLNYGADINITNGDGRTPLDYVMNRIYSQSGHSGFVYYSCYDDDDAYSYNDDDYDRYDYEPVIRLLWRTVETLKRHIVKLKTANLYVSEENVQSMRSSCEMNRFEDQCEEEIARMKSEKINNANLSFYDILAKCTSSLAIYMRNENIVQVLKSDDYKTKFPIYASIIESHFRMSMERKELLEQGDSICPFLFPKLPYACSQEIFSYLSNNDLRILIDAGKPLSINNLDTNVNMQ